MPTFTRVEVEVDLEFEVFCGTCGAGLCSVSDTRQSRNRGMPQVTVEACARCIESAKEEGFAQATQEYETMLDDIRKRLAIALAEKELGGK